MNPRALLLVAETGWLRLAPVARGALWMLAAGVLFTGMGALVKVLGARLDSFQVAFFRALFGLLWILPFAIAAGWPALRTNHPGGHFVRGLIGAIAMFCGFYSVAHLPLADATAYSFTKPLFLVLLAALFLGERVRLRRISATAIGFLGVLVMLQPDALLHGRVELAAIVGLSGAGLVAAVVVLVKRLLRTERPVTVMFYFGLISTAVTLLPALLVWVAPTWRELTLLLLIGALGAAGQSCMLRAYSSAEATAVEPFDYTRLLYAAVVGFAVFGEVPGPWMLAGATLIIASTLYIARREAQLARLARGRAAVETLAIPIPAAASAAMAEIPDRRL